MDSYASDVVPTQRHLRVCSPARIVIPSGSRASGGAWTIERGEDTVAALFHQRTTMP